MGDTFRGEGERKQIPRRGAPRNDKGLLGFRELLGLGWVDQPLSRSTAHFGK